MSSGLVSQCIKVYKHAAISRLPDPDLSFGVTPHHVHMSWHLTSLVRYNSQLFPTVSLNPTAPGKFVPE